MITRILLISTLIFTLASCGSSEPEEVSIRPVRTAIVGEASGEASHTYSGSAQTDRIINLSFRSTGIITKFDIRLGQTVKKGDLLAELDNVAARLAYEQAVSSLNSAKSDRTTKLLNLERVRALYEKGGVSLSDYENAKNGFSSADANYLSAQRSVDIQAEQIRYGTIVAPENGVIAAVNKEIDETVGVGETIAVLNAGTGMEIQVGLPESVINEVQVSSIAEVSFSALPNQSFEAEVTEVSPAIDRSTATYPVRLILLGSTEGVRSGMAASVNFDFKAPETDSNTIQVPATAVGEDSEGQFVFTLEPQENNTAIVRKLRVEVGSLIDDAFEIEYGLEKGDVIITAGVHSVLDGQIVNVE